MKQKKTWQKPKLTNHGAVEDVTQVSFDLQKIQGFVSVGKNLNAILSM
jgi:hypothetical protein